LDSSELITQLRAAHASGFVTAGLDVYAGDVDADDSLDADDSDDGAVDDSDDDDSDDDDDDVLHAYSTY